MKSEFEVRLLNINQDKNYYKSYYFQLTNLSKNIPDLKYIDIINKDLNRSLYKFSIFPLYISLRLIKVSIKFKLIPPKITLV